MTEVGQVKVTPSVAACLSCFMSKCVSLFHTGVNLSVAVGHR